MTIEKGSLKDWDDRHYQSIDDLPPEAWDAARDKFAEFSSSKISPLPMVGRTSKENDFDWLCHVLEKFKSAKYAPTDFFADKIIKAGFKRD